MGLKSQTKDYAKLAEVLNLNKSKIAKLSNTTDTTVKRILQRDKSRGFFSEATERRVHEVIEMEAEKIREYLNRLSGGATGN